MNRIVRGIVGTLSVITFSMALTQGANASTGVYIGKEASTNGAAVIAANADSNPGDGVYVTTVSRQNHEEGERLNSKSNNFSYIYPETTYEYRVVRSMDYVKDSSSFVATNEYGVCVTAVVGADNDVQADYADPLVKDGIRMQDISEVLASSCKTARNATNLLCDIIDENGAGDTCIVMIGDQREVWYVEVYSGHQYAAIKMPEDKVAVFGNEFMLSGIDVDTSDVIVSPDLITLAEENDFAQYDEQGFLDLARTYGDNKSSENTARTWIGHEILAPSEGLLYDEEAYYDLLFEADDKVSLEDVMALLRNKFEDADFNSQFEEMEIVQPIASGATVESHIVQIYDNLPAEISNVTWLSAGPSSYTPYVPMVGYMDELSEEYGENLANDEYKEGVASCEYLMLNALCSRDAEGVGTGIKEYWEAREASYIREVDSMLKAEWLEAYEEDPDAAKSFISEYCIGIMEKSVQESKELFADGTWHETKSYGSVTVVSDGKSANANCYSSEYSPYFDIVEYANSMGWTTEIDNNILTCTRDDEIIVVNLDETDGTIRKYTGDGEEIVLEIEDVEDELNNAEYKNVKKTSTLKKNENDEIDFEALLSILSGDMGLIDKEYIYGYILDFLKEEYPDLIDENITVDDFIEIIEEAEDGIEYILDEYGDVDVDEVIDELEQLEPSDLGIDEISVDDVVDVIDSLDDDTKAALGELFDVDVDDTIRAYKNGTLEVDVNIDIDADELGIPDETLKILEEYFGEELTIPQEVEAKEQTEVAETQAETAEAEIGVVDEQVNTEEQLDEVIEEEITPEVPVTENEEIVTEETAGANVTGNQVDASDVAEMSVSDIEVENDAVIVEENTESLSDEEISDMADSGIIDEECEDTGEIGISIKKVGRNYYAPSWAMKLFR